MGKKNLSHAQVWDDSALVESWNSAFEEYKKYHSIAARGEKLDADALEKLANEKIPHSPSISKNDEHLLDTQAAGSEATRIADGRSTAFQAETAGVTTNNPSSQTADQAQTTNGMAVPMALLSSLQDEGMKNLMMSWYYAGYYTGLYEGKQQALASFQQGE